MNAIASIEDVIKNYEDNVECQLCDSDNTCSDIPDTQSIKIVYHSEKRSVDIVTLKRYHWESLLNELRTYFKFEIVDQKDCYFGNRNLGSGMILLKKAE